VGRAGTEAGEVAKRTVYPRFHCVAQCAIFPSLYNLGMGGRTRILLNALLVLVLLAVTACQRQPPEFKNWPLADFLLPDQAKIAGLPDWLKPYSRDSRFISPQSSAQRWWAVSFLFEGELKEAQVYFHEVAAKNGYMRKYGNIYVSGLNGAPLPDEEEVDQLAGYTRGDYESLVIYNLAHSSLVKPGEKKHHMVFYVYYYGERLKGGRGEQRPSGGDMF